jgi:excisionase family DNA binding protein
MVLLSPKQVGERLQVSPDQVKAFVRDGELRYVNTGRGRKRPRMMFTEADLEEFVERRKRKEVPLCPSTSARTARRSPMTSSGAVVGFRAILDARPDAKPKR